MKKLLLLLIALIFLAVSCSSSKKAENDDNAVLPDEDAENDGDVTPDEDADSDDGDEIEDIDPCEPNPCENLANSDGICSRKENGGFECGCAKGYFWGHSGCKKIILPHICSGQTKCYDLEKEIECPAKGDEFYGQDAQYAALGYCLPQSFRIKNYDDEKTVIDNNTGLEWQQKVMPVAMISLDEAQNYCANLDTGNHNDWRLPSMDELSTLLYYDNSPTINLEYFPDTPSDNFWTSSRDMNDMYISYYIINFKDADKGAVISTNFMESVSRQASIRCVRGEIYESVSKTRFSVEFGEESFQGNSDTNLIWKGLMGNFDNSFSWATRLKYCEDLDFIGISEWRLANVRELETITADEVHFYSGSSSTTYTWSPEEHFGVTPYKDERYLNYVCITENPCAEDKIWNGEKCVENPCLPNPCEESESSTDTCIFNLNGKRSCYCNYGYSWDSGSQKCVADEIPDADTDETPDSDNSESGE
ncbi:DUF1566 domain-containing protein [bacterium]|nr:DUF1566 domain-containing protein [bacterium]